MDDRHVAKSPRINDERMHGCLLALQEGLEQYFHKFPEGDHPTTEEMLSAAATFFKNLMIASMEMVPEEDIDEARLICVKLALKVVKAVSGETATSPTMLPLSKIVH